MAKKNKDSEAKALKALPQKLVLIIDNDEETRIKMSESLKHCGCVAEFSHNATDSLKKFEQNAYSLVIMDMDLPRQSSLDLLLDITRIAPFTPVIMSTTEGTVETAVDAMKLGAFDYIRKPINFDSLQFIVQSALDMNAKSSWVQLEKTETVSSFLNELSLLSNSKKSLQVTNLREMLVNFDNSSSKFKGIDWQRKINKVKKYKIIYGESGFTGKKIDYEFNGRKIKIDSYGTLIFETLKFLGVNGLAIYLVEPGITFNHYGKQLESLLNSAGYFFNAVIKLPKGMLQPSTSLNPVLILISKKQSESLFIAELLNKSQAKLIAANYLIKKDKGDLRQGILVNEKSFSTFDSMDFKFQIEKLSTQYKSYKAVPLRELTKEINYVKSGESLSEKDNSIYIPRIGNSPVISKIQNAKIKHHNYFQIVLEEDVMNEYVAAFFKSDLGKLELKSLYTSSFINHLNKSSIENAQIAYPSSKEQRQIVVTLKNIERLQGKLESFNSELALNPKSATGVSVKLDNMLEALEIFSESDKIRSILRQIESDKIEFKETLSLDKKTDKKEKYIEDGILKTIVAFLNTDGGILLIGVNDGGEVTGIDYEVKRLLPNIDKYLLHFKNIRRSRIGIDCDIYISIKIVELDGKNILKVECDKSNKDCYLDDEEFYVRTNPANEKLTGRKLSDYLRERFKI